MLHDPKVQTEPFTYENVNDWWRGPGTCINGSWRKYQKAVKAAEAKKAVESSSPKPTDDNNQEAKLP